MGHYPKGSLSATIAPVGIIRRVAIQSIFSWGRVELTCKTPPGKR